MQGCLEQDEAAVSTMRARHLEPEWDIQAHKADDSFMVLLCNCLLDFVLHNCLELLLSFR